MAEADYQKEVQKLREDLAQLREDVSSLTQTLKDLGVQRTEDLKGSARAEYQRRREQFREQVEGLRDRGRDALDEVEESIGEHPMSSLLAAFGLGFIIAKMLDIGGRR